LEIQREDAEIAETIHPLQLKDLQHSTTGEQAMDAQPQDEDVRKLEQLVSRQKKRGINLVDMVGPKAENLQGGGGAERGLQQHMRLWYSTTEPLVERRSDLAIPTEEADE
jgi:hypothetical protein